ncbi:hypothetical protein ACFSKU_16650 [Pontibacter silvestris]|uniref:Uncharacterized protein n=1 Tax=Pontibacter silvestris TaxID=2305183 RepID=A0ABW4X0I7_9BACT|nr:hypothetical protein [Pontibacter silvestris]MCC9136103.1 hypothetical protein [Pontibacter silvestris]
MDAGSLAEISNGVFNQYPINSNFLDEVISKEGAASPHYTEVLKQFSSFRAEDFKELNEQAKLSFF